MKKIKKNDKVIQKSYGKDLIFKVTNIINTKDGEIAILKGITERVQLNSPVEELEVIDRNVVSNAVKEWDKKIENRVKKEKGDSLINEGINIFNKMSNNKIKTGKILHLDGDKKYSEKSYRYYKKMGLDAVVKNIPEYKQPQVVYNLLNIYNPDILVITGHDGMIRSGKSYSDVYNYKNSRYFIETVKQARRYDKEKGKELVIFAGACQSYFEALIAAGANFASSPARILIDFLDPLIVAEKIASTEKYKFVTIDDIEGQLRDGKKGVNGIGANGKMKRTSCNNIVI
mgnify:FL=1